MLYDLKSSGDGPDSGRFQKYDVVWIVASIILVAIVVYFLPSWDYIFGLRP